MAKELTKSYIDRQNILNNPYALSEIQKAAKIQGVEFEGQMWLIKDQAAEFFQVDTRTIERYLKDFEKELEGNGYRVLRGKSLSEFKLNAEEQLAADINVGSKTTQLAVFNFRAFLNLAMLLTESETARLLRQLVLDIVIDTINQRTKGGTKYINQRDEDFIISLFQEENYRKEFTDALKDYVSMGKFKYPLFTDRIYKSIFKENAQEYRKILRLEAKEKVRDTFYSEILDLVSSYEYGFAQKIKEAYERLGRKLTFYELDSLYFEFESQPHWKPLLEKARNKMASRDLCFRDALHERLKDYVTPLEAREFERFIGEKSKELSERLEDSKEVFKRLKERE